jgi:hypothetical protein
VRSFFSHGVFEKIQYVNKKSCMDNLHKDHQEFTLITSIIWLEFHDRVFL